MTDLVFPAGLVRIDETLVWRKLSDWLGDDEGRDVQLRRNTITRLFICKLNDGGMVHRGSSMLSAADALAQAMQMAVNRAALQAPTQSHELADRGL